jgi:NAD-dependent deacetylase
VSAARLAELVRELQPCVVLTGAGISTESGIPDFRSPGGLWRKVNPMQVGSIEAFRTDPARVWEYYAMRFETLLAAEPNDGHRALAELEQRGFVRAIVTQNIDLLHERAGSRDVVEVHGSIRTAGCPHCGAHYPLAEVLERLPLPECARCGDVLKPDVVFFGELLPEDAIDRATRLAEEAVLLLVVGSSLEVWPVAGLPLRTLESGGRLAIVNRGRTPFDDRADLVVDGPAGETLKAVATALATTRRSPRDSDR